MTTTCALVLEELLRQTGNDVCADCNRSKPLWTNVTYGILICEQCAGIHQRYFETSKVFRISTQCMEIQSHYITELVSRGNTRAKQEYEAVVPPGYRQPNEFDALVLREQWILDKYTRRAFKVNTPSLALSASVRIQGTPAEQRQLRPREQCHSLPSSPTGLSSETTGQQHSADMYRATHKEGYMFKRGKTKRAFNRRFFIVDDEENTLRYYNQFKNIYEPKYTFRLDQLNVVVLPEKIGHPHGMQITFDMNENTRRNLFIYTQTGKELVEWLCCIRSIKLKHLPATIRQRTPEEINDMLTHYFVKEGWLMKTGPRSNHAYRKRWFTLDRQKLFYAKYPLDAHPSSVNLGSARDGYAVHYDTPPEHHKPPSHCCAAFTLVTPSRKYVISAELASEREEWVHWLNVVINTAPGQY